MATGLLPKLALVTVAAVGLYVPTLGLPLPRSCLRTIGVAGSPPPRPRLVVGTCVSVYAKART